MSTAPTLNFATYAYAVTTKVTRGCRMSWHLVKGLKSTGKQEKIS